MLLVLGPEKWQDRQLRRKDALEAEKSEDRLKVVWGSRSPQAQAEDGLPAGEAGSCITKISTLPAQEYAGLWTRFQPSQQKQPADKHSNVPAALTFQSIKKCSFCPTPALQIPH